MTQNTKEYIWIAIFIIIFIPFFFFGFVVSINRLLGWEEKEVVEKVVEEKSIECDYSNDWIHTDVTLERLAETDGKMMLDGLNNFSKIYESIELGNVVEARSFNLKSNRKSISGTDCKYYDVLQVTYKNKEYYYFQGNGNKFIDAYLVWKSNTYYKKLIDKVVIVGNYEKLEDK